MDIDYKKKYIKYKKKYLNLKQIGGLNLPYFRIQRSPLHGVGLFAIRDIPKNFKLFKNLDDKGKFVDEKTIKNFQVKKLLDDYYCAPKGKLFVPDQLLPSWIYYINHSDNENIILNNETGWYYTKQIIKAGEELLQNYKIICSDSSEEY